MHYCLGMKSNVGQHERSGTGQAKGELMGVAIAIGVAVGAATDHFGLWIAISVAVGAAMEGRKARGSR